MNRIKAFISYSSEEKNIGGRLKQFLISYCGYDGFIAHDDIPGSEEWEKEIFHAIRRSDFFIPLVSKSFKQSAYTDQETGCAISLNKKIIPIKLDSTNPYGFINKYQALQYKQNENELAISIAHIGLHYSPKSIYYKKSLQSLVYPLCNSSSFNTTNVSIQILSKRKHHLSPTQITEIVNAMKTNSQIIGAYGLPQLKIILKTSYRYSID